MKELAIKPALFLSLMASVSFADVIGPTITTEMTMLFLILILAANFVINFALAKAMLYSFKGFRQKVKLNEIVRIAAITLIGFAADFFMIMASNKWQVIGAGVFIIMFVASYKLLFEKTIERKYALMSSAIFGIISNPVWLFVFL